MVKVAIVGVRKSGRHALARALFGTSRPDDPVFDDIPNELCGNVTHAYVMQTPFEYTPASYDVMIMVDELACNKQKWLHDMGFERKHWCDDSVISHRHRLIVCDRRTWTVTYGSDVLVKSAFKTKQKSST